jgi:hypothetical protein
LAHEQADWLFVCGGLWRQRGAAASQEPFERPLGHFGDEPHAALRSRGARDIGNRARQAPGPRGVLFDLHTMRRVQRDDAARAGEAGYPGRDRAGQCKAYDGADAQQIAFGSKEPSAAVRCRDEVEELLGRARDQLVIAEDQVADRSRRPSARALSRCGLSSPAAVTGRGCRGTARRRQVARRRPSRAGTGRRGAR